MRRAESLQPCRQSAVRMPGACDGRRAKNRRIEKEIVMALIIQVTDFSDPALTPYARLRETQLEHYYEPHGGLFIAESPKVIERALGAGYEPVSILAERRQQESEWETREIISRCGEIPVYTAEYELLTRITGFTLTKGLLCAMRRKPLPPADQILAKASRIAVLEKVVNPTNIGAIFRSAAALGMDAVLLTPDCSDPLYRRAVRVSMGTVFQIPWTIFPKECAWPEKGLALLKRHGFLTAAMALKEKSLSIDDPALLEAGKLAVILGNEGDGLSEATINGCDAAVRIPMFHGVDSLNVAAASAVAFWELGKRR